MTKIAVLGDIHFGSFARSSEFTLPEIKLQDENKGGYSIKDGIINILKKEKPNYLFIAGDLTSTGSPIEYESCYKLVSEIANLAAIPENNIIISLGNHDVDWRISKIYKDYKFDSPPHDQRIKDLYQIAAASIGEKLIKKNNFKQIGPVPFSGIIDDDKVIIFVLNSGFYCGADDDVSHGKIGREQLIWFSEKGNQYKSKNKWKIILLHHHPHNYPYPLNIHDISLLEEGSELLKIAGESGFNLICHGHRHHPKAHIEHCSEWLNPITFLCAGSCSVNASHRNNGEIPNCFHIFNLDKSDKVITLKNFQYSASNGWEIFVKNTPETPLDGEMYFSKPYDDEERKKKLIEISEREPGGNEIKLPSWGDLPLELKTLSYHKLKELIFNLFKKKYDIFGEYPNDVVMLRKE